MVLKQQQVDFLENIATFIIFLYNKEVKACTNAKGVFFKNVAWFGKLARFEGWANLIFS